MFGLEEQNKRPRFEFDLEKDLKKDKALGKKIVDSIDMRMKELEKQMKEKKSDDLTAMAYAYKAAKKVIQNIK